MFKIISESGLHLICNITQQLSCEADWQNYTVDCGTPMKGRGVRIEGYGHTFPERTLCEVEVSGYLYKR